MRKMALCLLISLATNILLLTTTVTVTTIAVKQHAKLNQKTWLEQMIEADQEPLPEAPKEIITK